MPSGKKARARARRAAKEAKAMEEEKEGGSLMAINHDGSLVEALMQRLTIDDLLREDGMVQCRHGIELEPHEVRRCREFITVFDNAFQAKLSAGETDSASIFFAGIDATSNFADIWDSVTMMKKFYPTVWHLGHNIILTVRPSPYACTLILAFLSSISQSNWKRLSPW